VHTDLAGRRQARQLALARGDIAGDGQQGESQAGARGVPAGLQSSAVT
jgi:hypothetical protein